MYTIQQDSANKLVIPFNGTDYDFLLIVFSYSCYESVGIFENTAGTGCDYEIVVNEVGSDGVSDPENGDVKISPRSTWKGEVYGQDDNVNLFPQYAALIDDYKFQVKGDSCKVYPNLSPQIDCLPATAIVQDQEGKELARQDIASGATKIITVNAQTMINVLKGDFTGEFDLSVQDQQGFYNDYVEGAIITDLSIATDPKLGSFATVRILGGLLASDAIPTTWDGYNDLTISQDSTKFNVIMIVYGNNTSNSDIRITNTIIDAPDLIAPTFTSAPTATNIQETSFDITATLNENGTVYGYLLGALDPKPTRQEIIDNAQSQFTDSGSGGTLSYTGLTNETNYKVYVLAVDTAGNRQADSTLVNVTTQTQDVVADISPEYMYHKLDIASTNADPVTQSNDSLTQTIYNLENINTVTRDIQNSKECIRLNGSGYLRTISTSLSSLVRSTFSVHVDVKLDDGQPPTNDQYIWGIINGVTNRCALQLLSSGILNVYYTAGDQADIFAQTNSPVFADGAMIDFASIDVIFTEGVGIKVYVDNIEQTLNPSFNGNLSSINMNLFNAGTEKLTIGAGKASTSTSQLPITGYMRNFIIQPVAYNSQNRIDLGNL